MVMTACFAVKHRSHTHTHTTILLLFWKAQIIQFYSPDGAHMCHASLLPNSSLAICVRLKHTWIDRQMHGKTSVAIAHIWQLDLAMGAIIFYSRAVKIKFVNKLTYLLYILPIID